MFYPNTHHYSPVRCNLNFKALCSVFFLHLFCDCASGIGRVTLGAFLGRFVFFLCSLCHLTGYHFLFSHTSLFSSPGLHAHSVGPWMRRSPLNVPWPCDRSWNVPSVQFIRFIRNLMILRNHGCHPDVYLCHLQIVRSSRRGCSCGRCASSRWSAVCRSTSSNIWSGSSRLPVTPNSPRKLSGIRTAPKGTQAHL